MNYRVSKRQRERYRVLIEDVADGFFETDLKGNFTFFNHALCRIFGRSRNEIRNRSFREFMDDANAKIAYDSFNQIYLSGKALTGIQWEIRSKEGPARAFETSANLIVDDQGEPIGFRGITRDVTDKNRAEQALKESQQCYLNMYTATSRAERRYRALLDFFPDPVYVLDMDSNVTYANPAFVECFGWSLDDLEGRRIPFVPEARKHETREGSRRLFREGRIFGFETQRLTQDQRLREVVLDAAIFYEEGSQPAGQVVCLRDITHEKRMAHVNQALFRIARSLYRFRSLDERLAFIADEIRKIMAIEGAMVILLDESHNEFFFRTSAFGDTETGRKFEEVRFPVDMGVAGHVYRTGKPLIVADYQNSVYYHPLVDSRAQYQTRSMLDVPLFTGDRIIGVLCGVNKFDGPFDQSDVELMSSIAGMVALPLENARINEALDRSHETLKGLNRAKDRVIHHLSHELKTPVSVLSASLTLLARRVARCNDQGCERIVRRMQRNTERILQMQYQIEDILREKDYRPHRTMSALLEGCSDALETLAADELGETSVAERVRARIDALFAPAEDPAVCMDLNGFVKDVLQQIAGRFEHRDLKLKTRGQAVSPIWIPEQVLYKVVVGLVRNAVENTPDGGIIEVVVREDAAGPLLVVRDFGVGITPENQDLLFENVFSTTETLQYASGQPFDFGAGGKGFDLLRMKIFSERYGFTIGMSSKRCRFLPAESDRCPGRIIDCRHCRSDKDCHNSDGTRISIQFPLLKDCPPLSGKPQ